MHATLPARLNVNFFVERVEKATDNKTSRCFATATDAISGPRSNGNGDQS